MGIDVGTTGCEAAAFSLDGELLAPACRASMKSRSILSTVKSFHHEGVSANFS